MCKKSGCKTIPVFNIEGETKGLYCLEHKEANMINVKDKLCIYPECKKQPGYNKKGEKKALYCTKHKKDGMVDVKNKKCIHPGCETRSLYNQNGEKSGLFCSLHKTDDMVDITHKKCIHYGCETQATCNRIGEKNVLYCALHKTEDMVCVFGKKCKSEWCLTQVRNKYDGYCLFCYINLFPDKPVTRNYKTKEYAVIEYVKTQFPNHNWIADKIVNGGCSKRRPDLLLDLFYQVVIIEIDENQHISYDCSCQNKRIMELSQDLCHRPIIFIRFNPDDYKSNEIKITSCWGQNKNGICVVKKTKKNEWLNRLAVLKEQIQYWISPENKTNKTIESVQLFYDT